MNTTTTTAPTTSTKQQKRQATERAQGMADYEQRVMVVGRYADGEFFIRAAEDLDVEMTSTDWMTRYGLTYVGVIPPTGQFSGFAAADILRAVIR